MSAAVSINAEQRLFVLKSGPGFSCLGFDVVFKRLLQYANLLSRPAPNPADVGKMEQYAEYLTAEREYISTKPQDTLFDPDTPVKVQAFLEAYRKTNSKVRIFLGNPETGKDWLEEFDVYGRIGRSMGPIKVALLIGYGEQGGGAILTANILRMVDAASKREVYRHPLYQEPVFKIESSSVPGYPHAVHVNGENQSRFKTFAKAENWIEFMQGKRMTS